MQEEVVIVHPINNSVGISILNTDQGVIQAVRTTPLGVVFGKITYNDGREEGVEVLWGRWGLSRDMRITQRLSS
jgi:hypothetical protein